MNNAPLTQSEQEKLTLFSTSVYKEDLTNAELRKLIEMYDFMMSKEMNSDGGTQQDI